ncbi:MAG: hypothetical protein ACTSRS_17785 [Candidatus Helarchaeota archaeon]
MDFCEECGSLLLPKKLNGKIKLVCKKCGFQIRVNRTKLEDYIIDSNLNNVKKEKIEIVKGKLKQPHKIIMEEREAYEDYFKDDSGIMLV